MEVQQGCEYMDVSKLRPADDIRLEQAKEKIKAMDNEYWNALAKEIRVAGDIFNNDPSPRTEYEAQKSVLKFEIAEIKYYGYEGIINSPNRQQEITADVLKKIQEKEKQIEVLKHIQIQK